MPIRLRRLAPLALAVAVLAVIGVLIWQGVAEGGVPDAAPAHLSRGTVILNSGILVLREGLEVILVLAAITASFQGANAGYRRPVASGAGLGLLATVATWFVAVTVIGAVNAPALHVQAATGLLAIVVLLVVMNWFFHKVYWTGWIAHHNKRRQHLMANADDAHAGTLRGLILLGFTAMYREGFEIVLFLQNLRLQAGTAVVLQGVALGVAFTAVVGTLTFIVHRRLPYKKMLVFTGILLGIVLVVMVGESVQEMQQAGWLPTTTLGLPIPDWMGVWLAVFPTLESLVAQLLAALVVIGSYVLAEDLRVRRPRRRGATPAYRPEQPPAIAAAPTMMRNEVR
ncbi:MAG TPA: FTR1 family protein [Thermomicrobiales bacterium]